MSKFLDELRRDLETTVEPGPACLSVDTLGTLAEGRLPPLEARQAREHLVTCVTCLHRYAQLRSLLDEPAEVSHPSWWSRVNDLWSWRLPIGWTVAVGAASIVVATLATTSAPKLGIQPGPSPQLTPLQTPGAELRTVTGRVESVRDASAANVVAHVLRIREPSGATYELFAWGRPAARAGDTVLVEGSFVRMEGEPRSYRGLAKSYRVSTEPQ